MSVAQSDRASPFKAKVISSNLITHFCSTKINVKQELIQTDPVRDKGINQSATEMVARTAISNNL